MSYARGRANGRAVLDERTVRRLRLLAEIYPLRRLARWAGVSAATVHYAVRSTTWTHVGEDVGVYLEAFPVEGRGASGAPSVCTLKGVAMPGRPR